MKTTKKMKTKTLATATCFFIASSVFCTSCAAQTDETTTVNTMLPKPTPDNSKKKIKIALLLDTSNSMDGLINQAKSQLWKIVNELAKAKCDNERPSLEIALYEYGNSGLSSSNGYIRQVAAFTSDLDHISEKLFSLTTNGGDEFCGHVIYTSLNELNWKGDDGDLRMIFIAGNEPFTQGYINYKTACANAKEKDVVVNTIFCGNFDEGINTGWKDAAMLTGGEYMSIEQNRQTVYIESPYDKEITTLNIQLNATYISYGTTGKLKKEKQLQEDKNAASYGSANSVERVKSKTSGYYKNQSWDLVDAAGDDNFKIADVKEEDLPAELQGKTEAEKEEYIVQKTKEREIIIAKINDLNAKRTIYIAEKEKTMSSDGKSLDAAMIKAIKGQAGKKKFVFEDVN